VIDQYALNQKKVSQHHGEVLIECSMVLELGVQAEHSGRVGGLLEQMQVVTIIFGIGE
jgi:hypothetical protein